MNFCGDRADSLVQILTLIFCGSCDILLRYRSVLLFSSLGMVTRDLFRSYYL